MPRLRAILVLVLTLPVLAACADSLSGSSSERSRDIDSSLQPRNMNAYTRP